MEVIAENRKARFEYFILEEFEAGMVLLSSEVKSLRERKVNISDAYVIEKNSEIWLHNMHIAEYKAANRKNHKPKRERKLLLHKKEINKLIGQIKTAGITVVPLSVYFNDKGLAKTKIAVVKGKKLYDKRATIKQREWDRSLSIRYMVEKYVFCLLSTLIVKVPGVIVTELANNAMLSSLCPLHFLRIMIGSSLDLSCSTFFVT